MVKKDLGTLVMVFVSLKCEMLLMRALIFIVLLTEPTV